MEPQTAKVTELSIDSCHESDANDSSKQVPIYPDLFNAYLLAETHNLWKSKTNKIAAILLCLLVAFIQIFGLCLLLYDTLTSWNPDENYFNGKSRAIGIVATIIWFFVFRDVINSSTISLCIAYHDKFYEIRNTIRFISFGRGILYILAIVTSFVHLRNVESVFECFADALAIFFLLEIDDWTIESVNTFSLVPQRYWTVDIGIDTTPSNKNNSGHELVINVEDENVMNNNNNKTNSNKIPCRCCGLNSLLKLNLNAPKLWIYFPMRLPFERDRKLLNGSDSIIYIGIWYFIAFLSSCCFAWANYKGQRH